MPVLQNYKWEQFAQAYAKTGDIQGAYKSAGYTGDPAKKAYEINCNAEVKARVVEIRAEMSRVVTPEEMGYGDPEKPSRRGILRRLFDLGRGAEAAAQFGPAVKAEELRGKAIGIFADQMAKGKLNAADMTVDELKAFINETAEQEFNEVVQ